MRKNILLLSGTHEGPVLAQALAGAGFNVRATVTRAEACANLFGQLHAGVTVETRGFTRESLADFLHDRQADLVLDATHPFAVRITIIAHDVCRALAVPLIRYERPDWAPPEGTRFADSFHEAAELAPSLGRRVMLTIGAKQLKHFVHLQDRLTLFARILSSEVSVKQATAAGFRQDRLILRRPPFTQADNESLFQEHGVDVLVTKASGIEGGVVEKVLAARHLGMAVLMIRRPAVALPALVCVTSMVEAVQRCRAFLDQVE